jgi:hypothetical protein
MIEVREHPEIEPHPSDGWQLMFWVLDAFNYATPFRAMLAEIAHALGRDPQNDLRLPAFEASEDFVEGSLAFGTKSLGIYYEYSLSYLSLTHDDEAILREVADRVRSRIRIVRA